MCCIRFVVLMIVLFGPLCHLQDGEATEQIKKPVSESIRIRQDTQQNEEQWHSDQQQLLVRYDELTETAKQLSGEKQALDEKIENSRNRIAVKQKQLDDIEQIQKEITPLIAGLIKELEQFIETDLPFLTEER
ncbi:MAG: DUF3450 family protein, partial [Desulfopila sp.]